MTISIYLRKYQQIYRSPDKTNNKIKFIIYFAYVKHFIYYS